MYVLYFVYTSDLLNKKAEQSYFRQTVIHQCCQCQFVRCCIYLTTYAWIKYFLKITIEGRVINGHLENKINTLYWPVEN